MKKGRAMSYILVVMVVAHKKGTDTLHWPERVNASKLTHEGH